MQGLESLEFKPITPLPQQSLTVKTVKQRSRLENSLSDQRYYIDQISADFKVNVTIELFQPKILLSY